MDQPSQAQHLSNTLLNPKDESDAKSSRPFTLRETRVWFAAGRVGTVCSTSTRVKGTTERSVDVVFLSRNIIWPDTNWKYLVGGWQGGLGSSGYKNLSS